MKKEKIKRDLKKNIKEEFDIDKEILRLKEQDYSALQESHGFMANGAIGGFKAAIDKFHYLFHVQFLLGLLSGVVIGLAYGAVLTLNSKITNPDQAWLKTLFIGTIFPPAIWLITFLGGALFTSHTVATIPTIKGLIKKKTYFKALGGVYLGNISGTGLIALLLGLAGVFNDSAILDTGLNIANHKLYDVWSAIQAQRSITAGDVFLTIMFVFFSGILCNLCVSATLPITFSTKSRGTAAMVMFFAILYFAMAGYQHSPANTFFMWIYVVNAILDNSKIVLADGATLSAAQSIGLAGLFIALNLIPAALGNWVSGGILMPGTLYLVQKPYITLLFDQIKLERLEEEKREISKEISKDVTKLSKEKK